MSVCTSLAIRSTQAHDFPGSDDRITLHFAGQASDANRRVSLKANATDTASKQKRSGSLITAPAIHAAFRSQGQQVLIPLAAFLQQQGDALVGRVTRLQWDQADA
jgi:hypothetical protein